MDKNEDFSCFFSLRFFFYGSPLFQFVSFFFWCFVLFFSFHFSSFSLLLFSAMSQTRLHATHTGSVGVRMPRSDHEPTRVYHQTNKWKPLNENENHLLLLRTLFFLSGLFICLVSSTMETFRYEEAEGRKEVTPCWALWQKCLVHNLPGTASLYVEAVARLCWMYIQAGALFTHAQ